ncbi:unnamed protein product [Camellia sinensis]
MEEASLSNGQTPLDQSSEMIQERDGERTELDGQNGVPQGRKEFVALAVGMEFESYDDAYKYYICYAKEVGFRARVRVKNSWFKRMKEGANRAGGGGATSCCCDDRSCYNDRPAAATIEAAATIGGGGGTGGMKELENKLADLQSVVNFMMQNNVMQPPFPLQDTPIPAAKQDAQTWGQRTIPATAQHDRTKKHSHRPSKEVQRGESRMGDSRWTHRPKEANPKSILNGTISENSGGNFDIDEAAQPPEPNINIRALIGSMVAQATSATLASFNMDPFGDTVREVVNNYVVQPSVSSLGSEIIDHLFVQCQNFNRRVAIMLFLFMFLLLLQRF